MWDYHTAAKPTVTASWMCYLAGNNIFFFLSAVPVSFQNIIVFSVMLQDNSQISAWYMESRFMKKMVSQDHVQCPIDFIVIKSVCFSL